MLDLTPIIITLILEVIIYSYGNYFNTNVPISKPAMFIKRTKRSYPYLV